MSGAMSISRRGTAGVWLALALASCRVPATIDTPPERTTARREAAQEHGYERASEPDEDQPRPVSPDEIELPHEIAARPKEVPASVVVTTVSVEPDEFRSSLTPHGSSGDELLRCVRESHADETTIGGSMEVDYAIGSGARVTAVTVRACQFPEAPICDCIAELIAKWKFRPNVQLVRVSARIEAYPRHPSSQSSATPAPIGSPW